jgi:hypothetical protein
MNITRGPYSANVDPIYLAAKHRAEYQVVISRYGTPVYQQMEDELEEAMRVAKAYIDWQLDKDTSG